MRRRNKGFTLVETLVSLLILLLISVGVTAGVGAAGRVYRSSLFASESELLSDTLETALSDVLRYSTVVNGASDPVTFRNPNYIDMADCSLSLTEGRIVLQPDGADPDAEGNPLLSDGAYSSMKITAFTLTYDGETYIGSYTIESTAQTGLEKTCTFCFRPLV